ncbi:sugar transferase [Nocardioides lijunqiniae]|uniref:sugar transferase n=1 Tax=Nocardioides lijunqiniae TaxID=2760832 RepID=UPI0018789B00|nr:sugar transferase [Nocardioides lijunqiniae]
MKRVIDIAVAAVGLFLSAPLLVVAFAAIRLDSRGPVVFRQERIGRDGVPFEILKLRTMTHAASGASVTAGQDPRITRVGRWLRSTKLDELPQFINVLRGEMSLVGPRPELAKYVALWPVDARREILGLRPGITDPGSIAFRREAELLASAADPEAYYVDVILPQKVALYLEYARTRTLAGDLKVLGDTISTVARG